MSIFHEVKKIYPQTFSGKGMEWNEIATKISEYSGESKTNMKYGYLVEADNKVMVLGEGTGTRAKPFNTNMTTDIGGNGHMKAGISALLRILYPDANPMFIPTMSKKEALEVEKVLKTRFNFHDKDFNSFSSELFQKRLEQLQKTLPASIFQEYMNKEFQSIFLAWLSRPKGSDYSTIKGLLPSYEKNYPGITKSFNIFFKGGFKPSPEPTSKNQLSLFEIIRKLIFK